MAKGQRAFHCTGSAEYYSPPQYSTPEAICRGSAPGCSTVPYALRIQTYSKLYCTLAATQHFTGTCWWHAVQQHYHTIAQLCTVLLNSSEGAQLLAVVRSSGCTSIQCRTVRHCTVEHSAEQYNRVQNPIVGTVLPRLSQGAQLLLAVHAARGDGVGVTLQALALVRGEAR